MIEIIDGIRHVRTKIIMDISTTFDDDQSTEETIKYCVEEDLGDFEIHDISFYDARSIEKMEQQHKVLESAITAYGKENQMIKAMEEMGELIQALARCFGVDEGTDDGKKIIDNVREETADVLVIIMQLIDIFGMDVYEYFDQKIERLEKRLLEAARW